MIKVGIGTNTNRETRNIDPNQTLREAFEMAGVDYSTGLNTLDGSPISVGDLDRTFADFGFTGENGRDKCFLMSVKKLDNAA